LKERKKSNMDIKQCSVVLNDAMSQVWGEKAVTATDLTGLVALGNTLIQSADANVFDNLYKALLDRTYRIVLGIKEYQPSDHGIMVDRQTYGAILEKVYVEPTDAQENASWKLKNGQSVDPFVVTLSDVKVKLFSKETTWEVPYTVTDTMIRTAFLSAEEMSTFLTAIEMQALNSMRAQKEKVVDWTIANFIGEKKFYSGSSGATGVHVIDLLKEFNDKNGQTLTRKDALNNMQFLKYAAYRIKSITGKFKKQSTLFNVEHWKRWTKDGDLRLIMLDDFVTSAEMYLEADTFHDSLVKMRGTSTIPYWQGAGENLDFDSLSKIDIVTSSGNAVTVNGVIAFAFDINALGVTIWNERTTGQYNGRGEYNNYWLKADVGLYNDTSENAVVFVMDDSNRGK